MCAQSPDDEHLAKIIRLIGVRDISPRFCNYFSPVCATVAPLIACRDIYNVRFETRQAIEHSDTDVRIFFKPDIREVQALRSKI